MKHKKSIWMAASVTVCFLLLAVTACKKSTAISPIVAKQSRLDWNLKTTVGAYQEIGNTDPKWDEPATNALAAFAASRSQSFAPDEDWATIIRTNCDAAVQAGCDDTMIRYLYIKYTMSQTNSSKNFTDAFCKTEADMDQSQYPSIRKFYAALRAQQQLYYTYPTNFDRQEAGELAQHIYDNLIATVADKTTPPEEAYEASSEGLHQMSGSKDWYERCYNELEKSFFANWPKESVSFLLKGEAYLQMAWLARGTGYAKDVTQEGWKSFGEHLAVAETSLKKAWQLNPKDPRIPTIMIRVDEAQQKDRDDMELWFNRAMTLNPNNYEACKSKLHYLYPQWYGSRDEMIAFGRECVASTNWGGYVPIILVDAHTDYNTFSENSDEEKQDYWKQPDVWPDIKASYDRFFELNPNATDIYKNYAWYAYHAEQWDAFIELAPKVRSADYSFFGGTDEFEKMIQIAKDNAGKPK
jgi:Domain of unknown function (DUF4034)